MRKGDHGYKRNWGKTGAAAAKRSAGSPAQSRGRAGAGDCSDGRGGSLLHRCAGAVERCAGRVGASVVTVDRGPYQGLCAAGDSCRR